MNHSDPTPPNEPSSGENFIPLRHRQLIQYLVDWLVGDSEEQSERLHQLFHSLVSIFHIEHLANLVQVEDLYESLDPDHDEFPEASTEEISVRAEKLFDRLVGVLYSAHYHKLDQNELNDAVTLGSSWGVKLNVNFEIFDRLMVFARGYRVVQRKRRRWSNFFRLEAVQFPEFHRLVIGFRLKPTAKVDATMRSDVVYLKMFKNIPESELEILLPGSTVQLSLVDRTRILIPSLSGAALAIYKITRGTMLITVFTLSAFYSWVLFGVLLAFYLGRGVLSYLQTKDRYQFGLTRNLYLKNLDNNMGVIYRLFNEAEEQEVCETILVYCVLLNEQKRLNENEMAERSIQLLKKFTDQVVTFDLHDALGKLSRFGLANVDSKGEWDAVPLNDASAVLATYWTRQFGKKNPLQRIKKIFEQQQGKAE
jgi:hypothetical protein